MELSEKKVSHCLSFLSLPAPTLNTAPTQSGNKISHKIRPRLDLSRLPVLHFLRPQTHFFIKKKSCPNVTILVLMVNFWYFRLISKAKVHLSNTTIWAIFIISNTTCTKTPLSYMHSKRRFRTHKYYHLTPDTLSIAHKNSHTQKHFVPSQIK